MPWWGWLLLAVAVAQALTSGVLLLLLWFSRDAPPEGEVKRRARRR